MKKSKGRGFASMTAEKRRKVSSKGGKEAHRRHTAHEFTSKEAREAGKKGGLVSKKGKKRKNST